MTKVRVGPMDQITAVILAAGQGSRMRSERPKPLAMICGKPMLGHTLEAVADTNRVSKVVVVVGFGAEMVRREVLESDFIDPDIEVVFVEQKELRGTGDALGVALTKLPDPLTGGIDAPRDILVVPSDVPLVTSATLGRLIDAHREHKRAATILSMKVHDPTGYGRIVRKASGEVVEIIEDRDADFEQAKLDEVNTSIYLFEYGNLPAILRRLSPVNSQNEYYLTDAISVLSRAGYSVSAELLDDPVEAMGVNDKKQLSEVEEIMRKRNNDHLMFSGVTIVDPSSTYIDSSVVVGRDTTIWPGTILRGHCAIGSGVELGPRVTLLDCEVGDGARLREVVAEAARFGSNCDVGPYVVVRNGVKVEAGTVVAPFSTLE